jgi:hypothetical protein
MPVRHRRPVNAGFLKWTTRRTIVRTGATLPLTDTADISVRSRRRRDTIA